MKKNNFDQSSTGTNIEIDVSYDSHLSRIYFEESIEVIQHSGYRTNTIAYYTDCGNVEASKHISFEIVATDEAKAAYLEFEGYDLSPNSGNDSAQYDALIFDSYGERITLLNYEDFNREFAQYNIQIKPDRTIEKIITLGYSQGDYAEVYYCPDDLSGAWGKEPTQAELQTIIDRLFWDQPIFARVTINGEEYRHDDLYEDGSDPYKWNPSKFAEYVAKESGVPVETIAAMLPKEVPYE